MRLSFGKWLNVLGSRELPTVRDVIDCRNNFVELPKERVIGIVDNIYVSDFSENPSYRAVLRPTNSCVDNINMNILDNLVNK